MTIVQHMTRRGKVFHRLSIYDLGDAIETGGKWRSYCPIHGSDHQRSLAISAEHGWGYCHACHATVFVEDFDPHLAVRLQQKQERLKHNADSLSEPPGSASPFRAEQGNPARRERPMVSVPHWQQEEVAALVTAVPLMHEALARSRWAQAYLEERAIPPTLALSCGVGYLSRQVCNDASLSHERKTLLTRWIGRIIFPLHSPNGPGFIGRTLLKWTPGMDENAHKARLEQTGAPKRWIKTNPAGWFGYENAACLASDVLFVEGGFDRLALLAAGLPINAVIALVGTAARPTWLAQAAPQVQRVVLALDADHGGLCAMERLADELRQAGLAVTLSPPPQDSWGKDWCERFRRLGPQSVWPLYEILAHAHSSSV